MFDPAQSVKDLLVAANMGTFAAASGWSVNVGGLPEAPDTVILCNATGGKDPYPNLSINFPSVQVMVRGAKNGYQAARTKIDACVSALLGLSTIVVNGDTYQACNQIGDVSYLGQDDNTRPLFSANFSFIVLPVASGNRVAIT